MSAPRPAILLIARADGVGGAERRSTRTLLAEVSRLLHPTPVRMAFLDRGPQPESVVLDLIRRGASQVLVLPLWLVDDHDARVVLPARLSHFPEGRAILLPALGTAPALLRLIRDSALDQLARKGLPPSAATLIIAHPGQPSDARVAQSVEQVATALTDMHGFHAVEAGFIAETPRLARVILSHSPPIVVIPLLAGREEEKATEPDERGIVLLEPIGRHPMIGRIIASILRGRMARVTGLPAQSEISMAFDSTISASRSISAMET